jgi:hypothetical protein
MDSRRVHGIDYGSDFIVGHVDGEPGDFVRRERVLQLRQVLLPGVVAKILLQAKIRQYLKIKEESCRETVCK